MTKQPRCLSVLKSRGFVNANEELLFSKNYIHSENSPKKENPHTAKQTAGTKIANILRDSKSDTSFVQNKNNGSETQRPMAKMFAQHNIASMFTKPSIEEMVRRRANGQCSGKNENSHYRWKPSCQRVDNYVLAQREDDACLQRGVRMVTSPANRVRNPIVDGGIENLKPSKRRQAPDISPAVRKLSDRKSFEVAIEQPKRKLHLESQLYESFNINRNKLSGSSPVTQTVKGRKGFYEKMNGNSCRDLLTMGGPSTYNPEKHYSRKPGNIENESLKTCRANLRSPDYKGIKHCDVTRDALTAYLGITRS